MLWGTGDRCQEGKVWGCSWDVLLVGLEGLWTRVLSIWTILWPHCCPSLSLLSRAGVIRADISTIPSARSTETEGKAKLQPWPGTGSKLAETPEK